jgi:bifunctional non-homologous end joining protein LigD
VATWGTTSATSSNAPELSEPALIDRPPAGPGWLHEVKHDGFRILTRKLGERADVWSRRGADCTDKRVLEGDVWSSRNGSAEVALQTL